MCNVIYARKSTESTDRQVQSIDDQLAAMRRIAEQQGHLIRRELTESKSAKAPGTRPVFMQLLKDIEKGHVTGLYTWSMSRLARNPVDGGQIAYLLQTGKLSFIRTADRTYLPDDSSLLLAIESGMATQDIQTLRKGVIRGMRGKVDRGGLPGRTPLGYVNNTLTKVVEPDPELFPVIRRGWDLLLTGSYSFADLHRAMRTWTVASKRWKPVVAKSYVQKLFTNPFYCGKIRFKGEVFPGTHLPMVTEEEFETVQRLLRRPVDARPARYTFAYTGFIRHSCGCLVTAERKTKHYPRTNNTRQYTYYHCSGSKGCSKHSVSEDYITSQILAAYESFRMAPAQVSWCLEVCGRLVSEEASGDQRDASKLVETERSVGTKLERLLELRLAGEVSAGEYQAAKERSRRHLIQVQNAKEHENTRAKRALAILNDRLRVASADPESIHELPTSAKRAFALALSDNYLLTLESTGPNLIIQQDPVLQLFAAFEPLRDGSEKPKQGGDQSQNVKWWAFVTQLRTTLLEQADLEAKKMLHETSRPSPWDFDHASVMP